MVLADMVPADTAQAGMDPADRDPVAEADTGLGRMVSGRDPASEAYMGPAHTVLAGALVHHLRSAALLRIVLVALHTGADMRLVGDSWSLA